MSNQGETPKITSQPPTKSSVVLLFGTIADTTWRMFVPTIGLTIIGVMGDNYYETKPWLTLMGIVVGTLLAGLLIRAQLKDVNKS